MFKVNNNLAILVLVSMLTLNYTESVLFKVGFGVTTFYFMASYLALSVYYFNMKEVTLGEENLLNSYEGAKLKYLGHNT
jgi:hypothetical protein